MQQDKLINNNITLIGEIVTDYVFSHEVFGEGFYNFDLKVARLSENHDILPVTISERLMNKSDFFVGSKISVIGQIRSYNNYVETEKKAKLILTVFARDYYLPSDEGKSVEIEDEYFEREIQVASFTPSLDLASEEALDNPNDVMLNGFVCKPPIYRVTPFGREIVDILLAVNRSYKKSDYIPCIVWGRNARFASKLQVGDNIKLWGRMQSRNYQKKLEDGETLERVAYEVSVSKIEFDEANL